MTQSALDTLTQDQLIAVRNRLRFKLSNQTHPAYDDDWLKEVFPDPKPRMVPYDLVKELIDVMNQSSPHQDIFALFRNIRDACRNIEKSLENQQD